MFVWGQNGGKWMSCLPLWLCGRLEAVALQLSVITREEVGQITCPGKISGFKIWSMVSIGWILLLPHVELKSRRTKKKKSRQTSVSQEMSALKTEISDYVFRDHFYSSWWKKFLWMWRAPKTLGSLVFPPECEASFWCWFCNCHLPLMIILLFLWGKRERTLPEQNKEQKKKFQSTF